MGNSDYRADAYGVVWADFLETWIAMAGSVPDPAMLDAITELSADGRVLEMGIGTGYHAIPLAARGVRIEGIDGSSRMLEILADKPGGESIPLHLGDFATLDVDGEFALIFVGSSSLFCLPDQPTQLECFGAVARKLAPGGLFVVDAYIHDDRWFTDGEMHFTQARGDGWKMRWNAHNDRAAQVTDVERVLVAEGKPNRVFRHREKYCSPMELDLMAKLSGMRLTERWGGWDRGPYTGVGHAISLYTLDS